MSNQSPTVGRAVHYTPDDEDPKGTHTQGDPMAATVTKVHNATLVDLTVQPPGDAPFCVLGAVEGAGPRTWCWPPRA